ncbi:MAG TPA: hypothetical protein VGB02_11455 [Pyrinomonadaceae bacterium]|jgi:ABC-type Na+ efflux pump permease subunit
MSVQETSLPASSNKLATTATHRRLGIIGMICAPGLYFASSFYSQNFDQPNPNQIYASFLGVLYLCGALASATAMRQLRATGNGLGAKVLFGVQIVGLFLAMMFDVIEYAAPILKQTWLFFVTDMAYPFSHVLMIVVGIAIVRAGVWSGWRRVPAFLIGFALPLFFAASALFGRENTGWIFIGSVTLGFFALGLAVFNANQKEIKQ